MENKTKSCIHCKLCTKNCDFLKKYDMDLEGFSKREDLAYNCFLCGKCKGVCPKDIDGKEIALTMRQNKVKKNNNVILDKDYNLLLKEKNPYKFANYKNANKKSVLFPGCNFISFLPKTSNKIIDELKNNDIGVIFDCCQKPIDELGLKEDAEKNLATLRNKIKEENIEEIIVVCPNCYYFLSKKLDVKIITIYEKLEELNMGKKIKETSIPIYYPCPDRDKKAFFNTITPFIEGKIKNSFKETQCCGLGGCAVSKESEISTKFAKSVALAGEEKLYTYCASCVGNFKRKGFSESYHILPIILNIEEEVPLGMKSLFNRVLFRLKKQ
ncbi:MAG: (Fe-S)-binding protein [Terrisporobacter sp.]|uniref:(Fe-S)-binding protein n=1 Tax=Terrisporobacter sp. TaxID=1965305 RepID=UPI002FC917D8